MTLTSNPSNGNSYALAFLRIGVGILFLIFGQYKVFGTAFTLHGGFQFWINKFLEGGTYPFMAPILRGFMLPLLFSSDYPGAGAPFWQYFGASLSHSVFALCFAGFLIGRADEIWSIKTLWRSRHSQ